MPRQVGQLQSRTHRIDIPSPHKATRTPATCHARAGLFSRLDGAALATTNDYPVLFSAVPLVSLRATGPPIACPTLHSRACPTLPLIPVPTGLPQPAQCSPSLFMRLASSCQRARRCERLAMSTRHMFVPPDPCLLAADDFPDHHWSCQRGRLAFAGHAHSRDFATQRTALPATCQLTPGPATIHGEPAPISTDDKASQGLPDDVSSHRIAAHHDMPPLGIALLHDWSSCDNCQPLRSTSQYPPSHCQPLRATS